MQINKPCHEIQLALSLLYTKNLNLMCDWCTTHIYTGCRTDAGLYLYNFYKSLSTSKKSYVHPLQCVHDTMFQELQLNYYTNKCHLLKRYCNKRPKGYIAHLNNLGPYIIISPRNMHFIHFCGHNIPLG
jgi:hypothetical protein